jgi:fused signal recognition particle receptor
MKIPGLSHAKIQFGDRIKNLFKNDISNIESFYNDLEEILISADIGVETTIHILNELRSNSRQKSIRSYQQIQELLISILTHKIHSNPYTLKSKDLNVLFIVGVNGTGKTTTIAKLSNHFKKKGTSVLLAACDTFRAAAVEQLSTWAERVDVPIVTPIKDSNPSSVLYNSIDKAFSTEVDLLIVDTAGRFHNRANLMAEIEKLNRILLKKSETHPIHKTNLMVLDSGTGQNAITQAEMFHKAIGIDGIHMAKMDSTSKGGIIIALSQKLKLPIQFIGTGEKVEDLIL